MNEILQKRIEEAAKVFSFNFPSELFHSLQTQHERKLWKDEIEQAYIYGGEDSLQNQWISIEEALPEEYIHCFVAYKAMDSVLYSTGNYYEDNEEWYVDGYGFDAEVTHWMSVPQLKGGEK